MSFQAPVWSVGWIVAMVVLIATVMLKVLVGFPTEWLLVIAAICAVRL